MKGGAPMGRAAGSCRPLLLLVLLLLRLNGCVFLELVEAQEAVFVGVELGEDAVELAGLLVLLLLALLDDEGQLRRGFLALLFLGRALGELVLAELPVVIGVEPLEERFDLGSTLVGFLGLLLIGLLVLAGGD